VKKSKQKSRKATLLLLLKGLGDYPGADLYVTPGESAARWIALQLVKNASLKQLDQIAAGRTQTEPFWSKQW
jgi:hypothetical protein